MRWPPGLLKPGAVTKVAAAAAEGADQSRMVAGRHAERQKQTLYRAVRNAHGPKVEGSMRAFVYAWRLRKSETCAVQLPAGLPWCAPPTVNGPLPPPGDLVVSGPLLEVQQ